MVWRHTGDNPSLKAKAYSGQVFLSHRLVRLVPGADSRSNGGAVLLLTAFEFAVNGRDCCVAGGGANVPGEATKGLLDLAGAVPHSGVRRALSSRLLRGC